MSEFINNQTTREEKLKAIIQQLHQGKTIADVKEEFADLLTDVGPDEIVRIEQALINEGLDPEQIQPLCDVHVAVFRDSLDAQQTPETVPGHPVFTYRAENLGVQRVLERLSAAVLALHQHINAQTLQEARTAMTKLLEYDKHYLRKENLLFSYLEHTGFSGPSKVMWGVHNDIRNQWKALDAVLSKSNAETQPDFIAQIDAIFPPLDKAIREMIYKEAKILFPAALERLSNAEWAAIREQGEEIGYCYARPGTQWRPETAPETETTPAVESQLSLSEELIPLSVGALTGEQIDLMLKALPVDVTFVDENDTVRYFSQTAERIFQRSPAIIGREVQNCHPPQSVRRVQQILEDFRAGTRDSAEFWIQMERHSEMAGMFIHIRYFALRDVDGTYRGTVEVSQNLAPLRALQGERRLLDE